MTVWFIRLITTMVTHHVITGSATARSSSGTLSGFHRVHPFLPGVAFIHLLRTWTGAAGTARLVVLCAKHVFHPWEEGAVLILKEGVREADGG